MGAGPVDDLERWAAEARAEEASRSRARERWLRTQDLESATMRGILAALAEEGSEAVVSVVDGRRHAGTISMVGSDFVVVVHPGGTTATLISLKSIAALLPAVSRRGSEPMSGLDDPPSDATVGLASVLAHAAGERRRVAVRSGSTTVAGELMSVGTDVAVVRTDGDPRRLVYVSVSSVDEVSFPDSL